MEKMQDISGFRIVEKETNKNAWQVMPLILTLLSAGSMAYGIRAMFCPELSYLPIVMAVFLTSLFVSLISRSGRRILAGLGVFVPLALVVAFLTTPYWEAGALNLANRILMRYNYVTGLAIDYYEVPECPNHMLAVTLFVTYFVALLTCYLGLVIARKHSLILAFAWIPIIFGSIFFQMPIQFIAIACAVVSVVGTFAYSQMELERDGVYAVTTVVLGVLIALAGGMYFHWIQYSPSQSVAELQSYMIQKTEEVQYGKADSPQGDPEQSLSEAEDVRLKVSMSQPVRLYLKGYTGSVWEDGAWEALESTSYSDEYEGMIKGYSKQKFHPLSQMSSYIKAAAYVEGAAVKGEEMQLTVQNVGAFRKYTYLPYGISFESLQELRESNQDIYVPGSASEAREDNVYSAVTQQIETDYFLGYESETWVNKKQDFNEVTGQYRIAEADYRNFVHKYYTSVEETYVEKSKQLSEAANASLGASQMIETTNQIRQYVKKNGELAGDWSAVDYASEAVLVFRGCGIPARYIEGYLADGKDAKAGEDRYYRVDVRARDAHAWVEVYKDGVGWIPVDVTPGFYEELQSAGQQSVVQQEILREQQQQREQAMQQPVSQETEEPEMLLRILRVLAWIGGILLGVMVLAVATLLIRRKIILRRVKKGLESEDMWVRLEMSVSLLRDVFSYKKWEESQLTESVKATLNLYWYSVNAKERVGEDDVREVLEFMRSVQEDLVEQASKVECLRMKYWEVIV